MRFLFIFFLTLSSIVSYSQEDTVAVETSENSAYEPTPLFSGDPGRAALYSLILPGAGQFYNKRYWKVPIASGAVIGMGLLLSKRSKDHQRFKNAYIAEIRQEDHEFKDIFNEEQLRRLRAERRKAHQTTAVFFGVVWLLNSVDAYVDAHLRSFDTSEDLSYSVKPICYPDIAYQGIGIQLSF